MNMTSELKKVISLFNKLNFILFKSEHVLEGKISNLDVLFENKADYKKASELLEKQGYVLYLSEFVEKYKRMYVKVIDNVLYSVHLHREVAWHGLIALDKTSIFERKKKVNNIEVPSDEDSLLIHVSHIIFEDFEIGNYKKSLIKNLRSKKLDWRYIEKELNKNSIKKQFYYILEKIRKNKQPNKLYLVLNLFRKTIISPRSWIFTKFKILLIILRKINPIRKGCLITLIGPNGTGKTTLTKKTLENYKQITDFFNGQFGYYFGWEPFSFFAKFISKILKKKKIKTFNKDKKIKFSLFKELIFIYDYIDYLLRYIFVIYPKLRNNKLVITDRYFYDIYGQYDYAPVSKLVKLLLKIYPKPNYVFVLDAKTETIMKRDKNIEMFSNIKKSTERDLEIDDLENQKKRYKQLKNYLKAESINTEEDIKKNIDKIIKKSWIKLVK